MCPPPCCAASTPVATARGEHQQRADERVDDELDRRLHAARARGPRSPDQEVERDQHQVEEGDEQREVLGEERAEHGRLGEHEVEVEEPRALAPARAGCRRAVAAANSSVVSADQEHVQAVDRRACSGSRVGDPDDVGDVLQAAARFVVGDVADRQRRARRASRAARARRACSSAPPAASLAAAACARERPRDERADTRTAGSQIRIESGGMTVRLCSRK